jgi:hypothetical protein
LSCSILIDPEVVFTVCLPAAVSTSDTAAQAGSDDEREYVPGPLKVLLFTETKSDDPSGFIIAAVQPPLFASPHVPVGLPVTFMVASPVRTRWIEFVASRDGVGIRVDAIVAGAELQPVAVAAAATTNPRSLNAVTH